MKRYVIAIGGNALEEKKSSLPKIFRQIAGCIAHLIEKGDSIAIVFGNGPQVGKLVMQNHYASKEIEENTIDECVAMTQALIGYQLEKELGNALLSYGVKRNIVNVITQVVVDEQELAHAKPTKPIGAAYSKEEADRLCRERPGIVFKEDSLSIAFLWRKKKYRQCHNPGCGRRTGISSCEANKTYWGGVFQRRGRPPLQGTPGHRI